MVNGVENAYFSFLLQNSNTQARETQNKNSNGGRSTFQFQLAYNDVATNPKTTNQ